MSNPNNKLYTLNYSWAHTQQQQRGGRERKAAFEFVSTVYMVCNGARVLRVKAQ